jgi:nitrite reductase/ring-hydroxylating ferredoxin subunit/DMSO/TMAO reductase YedYZ heme-binding membrane subunit
MSAFYRAVGWSRQKLIYDGLVVAGVALYVVLFVGTSFGLQPDITIETALIRGLGSGALVLLTLILCIGPLCRLDPRFLPLLYNRRHLGVTMFTLGLAHAVFSVIQFHAAGDLNPLVSALTGTWSVPPLDRFPFELLGFGALLILFLMAATSHDYWLATLTPPIWKALHQLVYFAYGLIVLHVALGALREERQPGLALLAGLGLVAVFGLQLVSGLRERAGDREVGGSRSDGFIEVCGVEEIPELRAKMACVGGERIAVFRYDGKVSCVSNVCAHQNGPLGEGRIVDGCITCPWHGYQYLPDRGSSPPPFTEKVPTFNVRVRAGRVYIDPHPNPPGTRVEPASIHD